MAVLVQNGTPLTHAVDDRPDVSVGDESPSGTTVGDGFARTEEETGTECAGEGDHLHVALLHVTLDSGIDTGFELGFGLQARGNSNNLIRRRIHRVIGPNSQSLVCTSTYTSPSLAGRTWTAGSETP
jgi:hypothetical protein